MKLHIFLNLDSEVVKIVDEEVLKRKHTDNGFNFNRSKLIEEALEQYFRIKRGIPYIFRKKK